jgi:hypothetical protein
MNWDNADTLNWRETNLRPSSPGDLISDINAPLSEAVEFDEVNGDPFLLYAILFDLNAN